MPYPDILSENGASPFKKPPFVGFDHFFVTGNTGTDLFKNLYFSSHMFNSASNLMHLLTHKPNIHCHLSQKPECRLQMHYLELVIMTGMMHKMLTLA